MVSPVHSTILLVNLFAAILSPVINPNVTVLLTEYFRLCIIHLQKSDKVNAK